MSPAESTPADLPRKRWFSLRRLQRGDLMWPVRLAFLYAGVILPFICHLMTVQSPPDAASYRSGSLDDKLSFTLSGPVGSVFYPLMVYPMFSLTLLLFREKRFASDLIVRFGIYTGMPVAAWYCAMLGLVLTDVPELLSWQWLRVLLVVALAIVVPMLVWGVIRLALWVRRRLGIPWYAVIGGGLALYALSLLLAIDKGRALGEVAAWPFFIVPAFFLLSLFFAPFWTFGVYLGMTLRLLWRYPHPPRFHTIQLMAALSWLAAFLAACRWSIVKSLEAYAQLPVESPGTCYIASAAAYGHPALVGSESVVATGGGTVRVNCQLRVFKAAELALRALAPPLHRGARRIYNRLGPPVASRLANPHLADLAYLTLKPAEWASCMVLRWFLGIRRDLIDTLFAGTPGNSQRSE